MTQDNPIATARQSLEGYVNNGPAYWPGSHHFTLVSLTTNGETDGGGADVCRDCVRDVAGDALMAMDDPADVPRRTVAIGSQYSAVTVCGLAPAYDLMGESDSHAAGYGGEHTACAQCGAEIE